MRRCNCCWIELSSAWTRYVVDWARALLKQGRAMLLLPAFFSEAIDYGSSDGSERAQRGGCTESVTMDNCADTEMQNWHSRMHRSASADVAYTCVHV